jgi:glutamine synthetase
MSSRTRPRKTATPPHRRKAPLRWLKERRITEVECLVPDITGNARGKIIPADKFSTTTARACRGHLRHHRHRRVPRRYYELTSPSDSDDAAPRSDTVRMVWAADATAQVIHDCYTKNGEPHELAPRNVLRRVLAAYAELGLRPVVAPELEFFLVQKNTDPTSAAATGQPLRAPGDGAQSYSIDAVNEFDPILDLMYDYADAMKLTWTR